MMLALLLAAQIHVATPVEELHPHIVFTPLAPAAPAGFNAATAKVFNVTARQFEFEFSPALEIDQGDMVTLNLNAVDVQHGFFLESYMTQGVTLTPGQPVRVDFIANTPGTFTFFCSVFCGEGHGTMFGRMTVTAVAQSPPSITSFTPTSAPITGGTVLSITGFDFQNNAVVHFGSAEALLTIVNSSQSITAMTPAHPAGAVVIKVTNPDGQSATANALFTFGNPVQRPNRRRAVGR